MDTITTIEQKIEALDQDIIDKQKHIDLLKEGISDAQKIRKIYAATLTRRKAREESDGHKANP